MKCQPCERDFPADMIQELEIGHVVMGQIMAAQTRMPMCPICARDAVNKGNGLPPDTPFRAPGAQRLYNRAVAHVQATNQAGKTL